MQIGGTVHPAVEGQRPPGTEVRQSCQEQLEVDVDELGRQGDVRPVAELRPVRRRDGRCPLRQAADQPEQLVVGPALVDVLEVQADHETAHWDGSAHIGFV
jgi:hypothetical protein